jgi:hypothetical protein
VDRRVVVSPGMVKVWRLADGAPLVPSLGLSESVWDIAVHDDVIVVAAGSDVAVYQPTLPRLPCLSARCEAATGRLNNG